MILPRRSFLTGLAAVIAAPAIVPYANIMPVRSIEPDGFFLYGLDTGVLDNSRQLIYTCWYKSTLTGPWRYWSRPMVKKNGVWRGGPADIVREEFAQIEESKIAMPAYLPTA